MNIDPRELHRFTPSRPDGVVCITVRNPEALGQMRELCGYPAGHPIHADPPNGDTPEDRGPQQDLRVLRGIVMGYIDTGEESYVIAMAALNRLAATLRAMPVDRGLEAQVHGRQMIAMRDAPASQCAYKGSTSCRICRRWLEGEWNRAAPGPERAELQRQMDAGHCDLCHERVCPVRALAP